VLATIDTPWTVSFQAERRGPAAPQTFQQLSDWSQSQDEAVKYYSGSATYESVLNVDELPAEPLYLDLGRVMVMARVWVNGEYAGGVWTSPYRVPVSGLLKQGQNEVRIEVVNNWRNRLIGDARLPEADRQTYATVNPYKADSELQASGLMGPVQLVK
jgi:beta-galactosidase/beta-glucuronidase